MTANEKANKENGKKMMQQFYQQQSASNDSLNFFRGRNANWIKLLLWAKGSQVMSEFLDYSNVSDGNKAWVNMDMTQQRLAPKFVQTLVESMAKTKNYACVEAIDRWSLTEKENRQYEALFRMNHTDLMGDIQEQSGVQLEPSNAYVPDDELSAKIYYALEDKLPKEIRFEDMLQEVMDDIKFEHIVNRKTLFDLITLNFACTKIEKVGYKKYTVRKCIPTNMIYNFFISDTGELEVTMIGEFYSLKVRDFRTKFGKSPERPDGLTEKEIFELAKLSTIKNVGTFNYLWNDTWSTLINNQAMPYDDCSIVVMDTMIDCGEDVFYVEKPDKFGNPTLTKKKVEPYVQVKKNGEVIEQPKPGGVNIIKRTKNTWIRGVYAPNGDKMLFWGSPDIIIPPYTDQSKSLCPYTVMIPNNDGNYVPSLFERAMEPLKEYTTIKLKRKQLISQLRPSGIRIDVESARNIDLGTGDTISWEEVLRIYNQTGTEIWSSKGVDPLTPQAPAISNGAVDTAVQKIVELTNILAGVVQEIRELLGVPEYRDGSDVGDRTSGVLQEQQQAASFNVTDFIVNANNQLWEDTQYKLCLLHWNDIVKEEPESEADMINSRFRVSVKTKSTEYQRELIERDIDRYSQMIDASGNPALTPKDAMYLREIDNYKLARWYMANTIEQNKRRVQQEQQKNIEDNARVQQQSNQQTAENEKELMKQKMADEKEMLQFKTQEEMKKTLLEGWMQSIAKGVIAPETVMPILQQLMPNISIPLQQETKSIVQTTQMQEQQQQEEMQEAMMAEEQGEPMEQQLPQ